VTKPWTIVAVWIISAAAIALYLVPLMTGQNSDLLRAAAVLLLIMSLLATGALPEYLTSLLFFLLAMALAIAPAAVVFSGFASSSLWLVFGGLIIVEAVTGTGLGSRVASSLLSRLTLTYTRLIALAVLFSTVLAY